MPFVCWGGDMADYRRGRGTQAGLEVKTGEINPLREGSGSGRMR